MTKDETQSLIDKLPKGTPKWAVGLIAIAAAAATSFVVVYTTARPEVQAYLANRKEIAVHQADAEAQYLNFILDLARSNQEQLKDLSKALIEAQSVNLKLQERVSTIETNLKDCETQKQLLSRKG